MTLSDLWRSTHKKRSSGDTVLYCRPPHVSMLARVCLFVCEHDSVATIGINPDMNSLHAQHCNLLLKLSRALLIGPWQYHPYQLCTFWHADKIMTTFTIKLFIFFYYCLQIHSKLHHSAVSTDAQYWYNKSHCPYVHPSVTFRYCMKTAWRIVIVFFHHTVAQSF